jgi:1-aminocyclopropane-1-carboxylate deaminase/D-cysteine desulfhydrase-like pyridoxal-dependent ACC family enzyme
LKKIEDGEFDPESNVLFIHTGGLQGRLGCDALPLLNP